jgi:hypothetical protein
MSQIGTLVFFTTSQVVNVQTVLYEVLQLCEPKKDGSVWRTYGPSREWEAFKNNRDDEDDELLGYHVDIRDIPDLYREGTCLRIHIDPCDLGWRIYEAIEQRVSFEIRESATLINVTLQVGEHDLFEYLENEEGEYFGRAFFSVAVWGYRTPNDCYEYRAQVLELPEIKRIKRALEEKLGPLEVRVYWE